MLWPLKHADNINAKAASANDLKLKMCIFVFKGFPQKKEKRQIHSDT